MVYGATVLNLEYLPLESSYARCTFLYFNIFKIGMRLTTDGVLNCYQAIVIYLKMCRQYTHCYL